MKLLSVFLLVMSASVSPVSEESPSTETRGDIFCFFCPWLDHCN